MDRHFTRVSLSVCVCMRIYNDLSNRKISKHAIFSSYPAMRILKQKKTRQTQPTHDGVYAGWVVGRYAIFNFVECTVRLRTKVPCVIVYVPIVYAQQFMHV